MSGVFCCIMEEHIQYLYSQFLKYPKVSTDTRKDVRNSLFFALSGEQFNGNKFAAAAMENGAVAAIIDDERYAIGDQFILVPNTLQALQQLAAYHRKMSDVFVFAITGSNGKTTTKELVAAVLESEKKIIASQGNLNNHIGVPLTLLNICADTEIAVVEMGANHVGEIAALCEIARPNAGLVTNIGKAHIEGFGNFEGVVRAKSELYRFLRNTSGKTIVNADDELLMTQSEGIKRFTYGQNAGIIVGKLIERNPTLIFNWQYEKEAQLCKTNLYGAYNFNNLMAAVTVGKMFGISNENINESLSLYVPKNNRSQQYNTLKNQLILDAYNANPVSMREAILSFQEWNPANPFLILGDMFELGEEARMEHEEVIRQIEKIGFRNVLLIGKEFSHCKIPDYFRCFESTQQAGDYVQKHPIKNANILLKGSRGMHLESLLNYL